ncbi:MAG: hypothetical protein RLY93_07715 [Sumerlaeia bacterium]
MADSKPKAALAAEETPAATAPSGPEPSPPAIDPESQPRTTLIYDFSSPDGFPKASRLKGLYMTDEGLKVSADAETNAHGHRVGILETPSQPLDFPSNAVTPLWKVDLPEGGASQVHVEVAFSVNGTDWTKWYHFDADADSLGQIRPTYPDGRPNPNYGYVSGGLLVHGLTQYDHIRSRVVLEAAEGEDPALHSIRYYYQDSTLGEGRLASPPRGTDSSVGTP